MLLNDGIAKILRCENNAKPGQLPKPLWGTQVFASYYGNKTVGVQRYWTAAAHDDRADLLIEIQRCAAISTADHCVLQPVLDEAVAGVYKIIQVQHLLDEDGQPVTDLTLERIESIDTD